MIALLANRAIRLQIEQYLISGQQIDGESNGKTKDKTQRRSNDIDSEDGASRGTSALDDD
jgi:ribosomal protein L19E